MCKEFDLNMHRVISKKAAYLTLLSTGSFRLDNNVSTVAVEMMLGLEVW